MMADELERLRAELKVEEEAQELLKLRAEVEALRKEQLNEKNQSSFSKKRSSSQSKKKETNSKEEVGRATKKARGTEFGSISRRVDKARSALSGLPASSFSDARSDEKRNHIFNASQKKPKEKRWENLVNFTRNHTKSIEYLANNDLSAYARASPCGEWCKDLAHCYAIDCEMCICEDPITKKRTNRELVRFSIVDASDANVSIQAAENAGEDDVILDSLVQPSLPVVDYVSRIHGIDAQQLEHVTFQRLHAQAALKLLCCDRCVLIGHAIHNDLSSLQFAHDCIVDTSLLFRVAKNMLPSLKDVAALVAPEPIKVDLQRRQHNSTVDARTSFLCADFLLTNHSHLPYSIERKQSLTQNHIFIHRIPNEYAHADLIKKAFELATGILVDSIINFQTATPYSKITLVLRTPQHANLAFESLGDRFDDDKTGKPQKKLFLTSSSSSSTPLANEDLIPRYYKPNRHGPYCKVRMA